MEIVYLINYIRTVPTILLCLILKIDSIVKEDLERNLWYIGSEKANLSSLNKILLRNKCFRNILYYRIHEKIKDYQLYLGFYIRLNKILKYMGKSGGGSQFTMDMEQL